MTKREFAIQFDAYGRALYARTMRGKMSAEKFTRLDTKLEEWERQLTRVTLRNGSAVRYSAEEA